MQFITYWGSHVSYLFFLLCEAQRSDASCFTVLAHKAKAAGLCLRIVPYSTNSSPQGLFLTAMNASAWKYQKKQFNRAWRASALKSRPRRKGEVGVERQFKHSAVWLCNRQLTETHDFPSNTCAMRKASNIFHWRATSCLITSTPQKVCHWTRESDPRDWFDGFFTGNIALTFSNASFIWEGLQGAAETVSGSQL